MKVTDRFLTAYLRIKGFQTVGLPKLEPNSTKVSWEFEDSPQLKEWCKRYNMGDSCGVLMLKEQLATAWEEIQETLKMAEERL